MSDRFYKIKSATDNKTFIILSIILLYFIITIVETFPLIKDIKNSIPGDLGDPLLNVWTLWWDCESIFNFNLKGYFDANVMYPYDNALAFSEHLTGEAILGLPFYIILRNPIAVYNILFLLSFVVAAFSTFLLTHKLTDSRIAGFIAGLIYAFIPHRFGQIGHIQTLYSGFFPLTFYFLLRLIDRPSLKKSLFLSLFIILQSLINMYYSVYIAITLPLIGIPYILYKSQSLNIRLYGYLILTFATSFFTLLPFFIPYIELREAFGLTRDIKTIASLHDWKNLIGINRFNWLYANKFIRLDINEGSFFTGITISLLAMIGIFEKRLKEIYRMIFLILITVAFLITAGPEPVVHLGKYSLNYGFLYRFLYNYFPAFDGTRVPMRFFIFIALGISFFAGTSMLTIKKISNKYLKIILFFLITSSILFEFHSNIPIIHYDKFTRPPEILKTLRNLKEGPVIFFPTNETYQHILYASIINKPVYTSFTGYIHFLNRRIVEIEKDLFSRNSIKILSAIGIKYIVILNKSIPDNFNQTTRTADFEIKEVYRKADGSIYELIYNFNGHFDLKNFSDFSVRNNSGIIIINLISDLKQEEILIPKRLFYNLEVLLIKENNIIRKERFKIKVPEIIEKNPISEIRINSANIEYDSIKIIIKGSRKERYKILFKNITDKNIELH